MRQPRRLLARRTRSRAWGRDALRSADFASRLRRFYGGGSKQYELGVANALWGPFRLAAGGMAPVPLMHTTLDCPCAEIPGGQLARLAIRRCTRNTVMGG